MNQIRIIGGKFSGKKINVVDIAKLRPTPNRIRETVFNWLMHDIKGATCLDLFAGSGALGFEAYSRGAKKILMIEKDVLIFKNLKKVIAGFDADNLKALNISAENFLTKNIESFDILFLDPPFQSNYDIFLQLIENSSVLNTGGLLYLESNKEINMNATIWEKLKLKKAGSVFFGLYKKHYL